MSRLMIVEVPSYSCEFKGIREICELVRCGECSKRMTDDCPMCNECNSSKVPTEDDDFCSYGEREGE